MNRREFLAATASSLVVLPGMAIAGSPMAPVPKTFMMSTVLILGTRRFTLAPYLPKWPTEWWIEPTCAELDATGPLIYNGSLWFACNGTWGVIEWIDGRWCPLPPEHLSERIVEADEDEAIAASTRYPLACRTRMPWGIDLKSTRELRAITTKVP